MRKLILHLFMAIFLVECLGFPFGCKPSREPWKSPNTIQKPSVPYGSLDRAFVSFPETPEEIVVYRDLAAEEDIRVLDSALRTACGTTSP